MKDLLTVCDSFDRKQMFEYMFKKEMYKIRDKNKKQLKSKHILEKRLNKHSESSVRSGIFDPKSGAIVYGLWHNSLFTRIERKHLFRYLTKTKLKNAALFGQKVVIDMDFDPYMTLTECRILAKQLGSESRDKYVFKYLKLILFQDFKQIQ